MKEFDNYETGYEVGKAEGIKIGRADLLNWLKKKSYLMCDAKGDYYDTHEIAEQLKEKKNENIKDNLQ